MDRPWMKRIRQKSVDLRSLKLSPEEGFVLSRIDGTTTMKELVALTGLDQERLLTVLERLAAEGATEDAVDPAPPPPRIDDALRAFLGEAPPEAQPFPGDPAFTDAPSTEGELPDGDTLPDGGPPPDDASSTSDAQAETEAELGASEARNALAYRQIYETTFHPLPREERARLALAAEGERLLALCFDPDPQVLHALLGNPASGLEHARLVAFHHRTQVGLETVARRVEYLKDTLVQRRLLRNPQVPGTILNRIIAPKPMLETYKLGVDREIPERTRMMTRELLRKKFMLASADEKASLLFKTEGRCLVLLVNCSLDGHATQILCSKGGYTILFIQNLTRWSATPPALLAHLLRVPVVRRNVGLRKMLLKHPNTPADAKRSAL